MNFKNKKIVIMGLGRMACGSGISAALFLAKQKADIIVTDLNNKSKLNKQSLVKIKKYKNIKLILGKHRQQDFKNADLIVKNPAVKDNSLYLQIAKKNKIKITTDLELFFDYINDKFKSSDLKIIGITGTRGKSTTTTLLYEILKVKFKNKVYLAGNIGNSPLNIVSKIKKNDIIVMEISSFQLHDILNHHFNVAVITNILPDHLDYYKTMAGYIKDKTKIFNNQNKNDCLLLNKTDKKLAKLASRAKGKVVFFSKNKKIKLKNIKLIGEHNLYNIDCAWQTAKLMKVSDKIIKKTVENFSGVKDRLELVRNYKKIKFYNDTTATHPAATAVALQALPKNKIILISGGNTKNLSLVKMSKTIKQRVKHLILVPGNANKNLPNGINVKNINQAVKIAWQKAIAGDVILFSPGLTWLPKINEFKRGEEFVRLVKNIK